MFRKRLYKTQHPESLAGQSKALALKELGFTSFPVSPKTGSGIFLGRRGGALSAEDFGRRRRGGALFPQLLLVFFPYFRESFLELLRFPENAECGRRDGRELRLRFFPGAIAVLRLFRLSWTGLFKLFGYV